MSRYFYDLHVHSCLSPCADNEATPNNIAGMATLMGLNIVALTDHNSVKNCPAFFEAAKRYGIIPVPGMELTTAEDIHVVCLFPELTDAMAFGEEIESKRIRIKNRTDIFGEQLILNGDDEIIGTEEFLLPNATTVSLDETPKIVANYHGVCYPAHIDRDANGVIAVLGAFPPEFACFELHDPAKEAAYREKYRLGERQCIVSSDAHYLTDLREENAGIDLADEPYSSALVRRNLIEALKSGGRE